MPIEVFYGKIPVKERDGVEKPEYGYMLLVHPKNSNGDCQRVNICEDTAKQLMGDLGAMMKKVKRRTV